MMLPVGFEQEDQKQDGTASPCQWIGPGNHLKDWEEPECCGDVDDTQAAPEKQHSRHWHNSIAAASLITPAEQWEKASRKKNRLTMWA